MEQAYRIRPVEKADESKVERLIVDDVYDWKPWVCISLRHGMFTAYPKSILGVASALFALGAATGQSTATMLLSLFLLLGLISWTKMAGICWFMRKCPEFVEKNLTEKYAEDGCAFLLAEMGDEIIGCVGIKKRNDQVVAPAVVVIVVVVIVVIVDVLVIYIVVRSLVVSLGSRNFVCTKIGKLTLCMIA